MEIDRLAPLIGRWKVEASFPGSAAGETELEWMEGRQFVVQRWVAPDPAPDGLAVIGSNASGSDFVQHYFDARGVARIYQMGFDGTKWTLQRDEADFSPLDFRQRFEGRLVDDGSRIEGRWEICHDGRTWENDFDLSYTRLGS